MTEYLPHLVPGTGGLIVGAFIFVGSWAVAYLRTPYPSITFEPRGPGSFEPRLANYLRASETLIGLASGSVVLLAGSSIVRSGGHLPWFYASPLVLLGVSVIYSVGFIGFLIYFYEAFLHFPESYTRLRYSLVQAFGFSSLICFSLAYVWLAFTLGNKS